MSVEFKSVEFEVEPVYCSVEPIHYDADKCIACGRCERNCPFGVDIIGHMRLAAAKFGY